MAVPRIPIESQSPEKDTPGVSLGIWRYRVRSIHGSSPSRICGSNTCRVLTALGKLMALALDAAIVRGDEGWGHGTLWMILGALAFRHLGQRSQALLTTL